ncbi:Imidazolonepropionase [Saccharopolyspora kobensis]|uniref:Imidazolonepropionase n=1 Tax=Saccharopolyspora kobensis TaxID=146035 RepID=A0A1H5W513_9PSEU|nr:amidohydrolase family protein [Saccharopolyspora kobensis]SEF94483.1 Imidazolonepropionase [Saccharopolyspora kobensis]SFD72354.1 Imidazolonepropionase [Saccharopolyspora kobensis]
MNSLVLRNALLLDVESGTYREGDLVCADGRIAETGPRAAAPAGATEVDLRGGYVLPGLIDAHVHVAGITADTTALRGWSPSYIAAGAVRNMGAMLDRGFTTVRDVGGADYGFAAAQEDGLIRGPRLIFGGKALSQTGGHGDKRTAGVRVYDDHPFCGGSSRVADGVDGVRLAARDELRRGAHHIKVMASGGVASPTDHIDSTQYSMDELRAIVDEARAAGRYVTVHAYPPAAINRALEAGARCVEHGNLLDDRSVQLLVEREAFLVPTLVTYWALQREGMEHGLPRGSWEKVAQVLEGGLGALERAVRGGVAVVFGTDLLGGMQRFQSEEFRIRAEVQSPLEIIRSATSVAAELVRMPGEIGTLRPGARADLIVVDTDPLADVTALAGPLRMVVQSGRIEVG